MNSEFSLQSEGVNPSDELLKIYQKDLSYIFNETNIGMWLWNTQTGKITLRELWSEFMDSPNEQVNLTIESWLNLVHPEDCAKISAMFSQIINGKCESDSYCLDYRMNIKGDTWSWIHERGKILSVSPDGKPLLVSGFLLDISEQKQQQQEIEYLSYHDQLTGLYNRRYHEEALANLDKPENLPISIALGDVNGLKLTNDSFGHLAGDKLLIKVAEVLKEACSEHHLIARFGGDEFVILLPKTSSEETEKIMKDIKRLTSKEHVGSIAVSISFGYETKNYEYEEIDEIFKKAEDHMYKKKLSESPSIRGKTIDAIISALYEKNKREEQHSHRVSELCRRMGIALHLTDNRIGELKTMGLLHDIGKIAIDENILNKSGKLTDDEWKEIQRHPEIGFRILNTVNDMSELAACVLSHHERWDGKGYPKGLSGTSIPFASRIISIADSYDAMTSERAYRAALPESYAVEELKRNAGTQFDPELVPIFAEIVLKK